MFNKMWRILVSWLKILLSLHEKVNPSPFSWEREKIVMNPRDFHLTLSKI